MLKKKNNLIPNFHWVQTILNSFPFKGLKGKKEKWNPLKKFVFLILADLMLWVLFLNGSLQCNSGNPVPITFSFSNLKWLPLGLCGPNEVDEANPQNEFCSIKLLIYTSSARNRWFNVFHNDRSFGFWEKRCNHCVITYKTHQNPSG